MGDLEQYEVECLRQEAYWDSLPETKEEQYLAQQDQFIEQNKFNSAFITVLMRCSIADTIAYLHNY